MMKKRDLFLSLTNAEQIAKMIFALLKERVFDKTIQAIREDSINVNTGV